MTLRLLISALIATIAIAVIYWLLPDLSKLVTFYGKNLRGSLFGGFLTVGGFLFSLKTFIIIKMKENVYDHQSYRDRVDEQRKLNSEISHYGPLRRLSHMLFASVLVSILTAVSQFTIGLIEHPIAALACIWSAFFTISLLVLSLLVIKGNLDQWFNFLEEEGSKHNRSN